MLSGGEYSASLRNIPRNRLVYWPFRHGKSNFRAEVPGLGMTKRHGSP
jgi:hypothetical protein